MTPNTRAKLYLDADGAILGRVGSTACKELLKGKEVFIINAEKAIISGNKENTMKSIIDWRRLGGIGLKGPKVSKMPDRLMKRMIRGMLPWDRTKGREAFDRLRCFVGNGDLTETEVKQARKMADRRPLKYISVKEVSDLLYGKFNTK